jgi:RimJ/RimL family protein N-acetyltransferase
MNPPDRSPHDVHIRDVEDNDLELFYEHQLDPVALQMAVFPARERPAFMAHWAKIRTNPTGVTQTIVADDRVVGNLLCWEQSGIYLVGYWIGRADWGRGIATRALALFVRHLTWRPLHAYVEVNNTGSIRVLQKCGFRQVAAQDVPPSDSDEDEDVEEVLLVLETAYERP